MAVTPARRLAVTLFHFHGGDALDRKRLGKIRQFTQRVYHDRFGAAEPKAGGFVGGAERGVWIVQGSDGADGKSPARFPADQLGGFYDVDAANDPLFAAIVGCALSRGVAQNPKRAAAMDFVRMDAAAGK